MIMIMIKAIQNAIQTFFRRNAVNSKKSTERVQTSSRNDHAWSGYLYCNAFPRNCAISHSSFSAAINVKEVDTYRE